MKFLIKPLLLSVTTMISPAIQERGSMPLQSIEQFSPPIPLDQTTQTNCIEGLSKTELYPHLEGFYAASPTFKQYWNRANVEDRNGLNTSWKTLAGNACLMVQAFKHLQLEDWAYFHQRNPNVPRDHFEVMCKCAKEISEDPTLKKLAYLLFYARDFGWMEMKGGQFHQVASRPIMEEIVQELKIDCEIANELGISPEEAKELILSATVSHSMPVEMFLGEVSYGSARRFIDKFNPDDSPLINVITLLNLMETNSIKIDLSALYADLTSFVTMLLSPQDNLSNQPSIHEHFLQEIDDKRVNFLAASEMRSAKTPDEKHTEVRMETLRRESEISAVFNGYASDIKEVIALFLRAVDLHYFAGTFPKMEPKAIARLIKISALRCISDDQTVVLGHVINMSQPMASDLNKWLVSDLSDIVIAQNLITTKEDYLVWTPIQFSEVAR